MKYPIVARSCGMYLLYGNIFRFIAVRRPEMWRRNSGTNGFRL
jgi:hypothetical protein